MFEERLFNLQLFADPDGAEDDDVLDDESEEEEPEDEFDLEDEEEDEEDIEDELKQKPKAKEEEKDEKEEEKEEESEKKKPGERVFTESEVQRMMSERNQRDPVHQAAKRMEALTGKKIEELPDIFEQQYEEEEVNKLVEEKGWDEEDARKHIRADRESKKMSEKAQTAEQQQKMYQNAYHYSLEKGKNLNDPLVKKYEQEIDDFSGNGLHCSFDAAVNYVLGKKIRSGELTESIKSGAKNKTLKDIEKQDKTKVEQGTYSGKSQKSNEEGLDSFTKGVSAALGISPKEIKAERAKIAREKKKL